MSRTYALPALAFLYGVIGLAIFWNGLGGDFVWDDRFLILDSPFTKSFDHLGRIFATSFWDLGEAHDRFRSFYRPVVITSYVVDYRLWGANPVGFHGTNLLLHIAISLLSFEFLRIVSRRIDVAAIAGLLFLVHPVHTESVTWISGRTDLLCAFFYLSSLLIYLAAHRGEGSRPLRVLSLVTFMLALFSKEMAVTLPLVLVLLEVHGEPGALDREAWRRVAARARKRVLPFVILTVAALAWRNQVLGSLTVSGFDLGPVALVLSIVHVMSRYIRLLVWPLHQDIHWSDAPVSGFDDPRFLVDLAVVAATVGVIGLAARRDRRALFGAAWLGLTLVPAFNIGSFGDVILAERFLYIPSLGFSLLVALAVERLARGQSRPRIVAAALVVALSLPLALLTVQRNRVWITEVGLFESAALTSPRSGYILANLGFAYAAEERYEKAAEVMERAVSFAPLSALSWSNYGVIFERLGAPEAALEAHARAVQLDPEDPRAKFHLGNTLKVLGRREQALQAYRAAIELKPEYGEAYTNLGLIYFEQGKLDQAEAAYVAALAIDSTLSKAHNNMGGLRMAQRRWPAAATAFQQALRFDPSSAKAARNLGECLEELGRFEDATRAFQLARALDPELTPASVGLARTLAKLGESAAAQQLLVETITGAPDSEAAHLLLAQLHAEGGRPGDAVRLLEGFLAEHPNSPRARAMLGRLSSTWPAA